ncbi:Glycosyl transferase, family 1, partial [Ostreococcus tauri]
YESREGKLRLDVYSSFSLYGWDQRDEPFEPLFDVCRQHPGCEYHGAVSNAEVREALTKAHIFAYPSIWQETSCIAAIEALSAGVHVVTSSLAALPETLGTFATMYQYAEDTEEHLAAFERALGEAIDSYWSQEKFSMRRVQQVYASQVFGWGTAGFSGRADDWVRVLGSAHELFNGERTLERQDFNSDSEFADALFVAGRVKEHRGDVQGAMTKYRLALEFNALNSYALVSLGVLEMTAGDHSGDREMANSGVNRLEFVIDNAERLSPPLKPDSAAYYGAAVRSGYYREIHNQHARAIKSFDMGLNTSQAGDSDCWEVYRATMVPHFPLSPEEERGTIREFNARIDALLARGDLFCQRENALANAFSIAYYYTECDYKEEYSKWVRLKATVYPKLQYFSPQLAYERDDSYLTSRDSKTSLKRLKSRKIKLGVVSSFFMSESSIWGNFGYIVRGLQQDKRFEVDFVFFPRNLSPIAEEDKLLSLRPESNIYLDAHQSDQSVLDANRKKIEARKFDVLLYLDLHMTGEMHDYAMAKLAPVQITTHGHPVTSGIPELIMDYFLSWDLAELPDKVRAQTFYTEKLLLIKSNKQAWEYFVPRTKDEVSLIKGHAPFSQFTRENIDFIPDEGMRKLSVEGATWYFCPQAAFKYHVTFDRILGEIQKRDSSAVIILMQLTSDNLEDLHAKVIERLSTHGGVDLDRVVFIPRMKHYQLMAMYKFSDVVLDSVYFGGDTTTREAFEVGSPVVTLPGKTIGQRWTQAYYKVMGISDYIVDTADEYVSVATKFANADSETKRRARERIKTAYHKKLVANPKAPKLWGDAIFRAATAPTRWHWRDQVETSAEHDEF